MDTTLTYVELGWKQQTAFGETEREWREGEQAEERGLSAWTVQLVRHVVNFAKSGS